MTSRTEWMEPWISRGERWVSGALRRWNRFTSSTPSNVGLRGYFLWLHSKMIMRWDHLEKLFKKPPLKYGTHTCSFCLYVLWVTFSCRKFLQQETHYRCVIGCGYLLVPTSDWNVQCDYKSEPLILRFLTPLEYWAMGPPSTVCFKLKRKLIVESTHPKNSFARHLKGHLATLKGSQPLMFWVGDNWLHTNLFVLTYVTATACLLTYCS